MTKLRPYQIVCLTMDPEEGPWILSKNGWQGFWDKKHKAYYQTIDGKMVQTLNKNEVAWTKG